MKPYILFCLIIFMLPSITFSETIYGKIDMKEDEATTDETTTDQITAEMIISPNNVQDNDEDQYKTYSAEIEIPGSYKIAVKETGECSLKIIINNQTLEFEVHSKEKKMRYNFIIEKDNDGNYILKRN